MQDFRTRAAELRSRLSTVEALTDEPLKNHTSFRIGGPVPLMLLPRSPEELSQALAVAQKLDINPLVLGNGTNVLAEDCPLDVVVIKTHGGMEELRISGAEQITAGCGVLLSRLASFACDNSLTGLEFAHGIPGSLGGAAAMNAGAYGGEMKNVILSVLAADKGGAIRELGRDELDFSYRHSALSDKGLTALSVRLALSTGEGGAIRARMDELSEKRRASQPLNFPSAGSTFKRPVGGYAAALIDEAGLKGFAVGGAQVSEKHAGFVINRGDATFSDVYALMKHIRDTVYERTGIELEPEVRLVRAHGMEDFNWK